MNILLVDKRVQDYETIVAAIDPALAVCVVFDYYEDTFDAVKARIGALGLTNGTTQISGGLIQHNYRVPIFTMLASADVAPIAQVAEQDPELERWTQFRDFITWCKTEFNAAHFDMMACALYSNPDWKYVIDTLTAQTGVTVRASTDDTGAASLGGDWFLESHTGVNLKTVYFTEAIDEYHGLLLRLSDSTKYIKTYDFKGIATGSVITWGSSFSGIGFGGGGNSSSVSSSIQSDVISIYSAAYAHAALKSDGSVVAWGDTRYGGNYTSVASSLTSGVVSIYSTQRAFAALKSNGSVVAWGDQNYGGNPDGFTYFPPSSLSSGVVAVYSTEAAFAALKSDGSVQAWGSNTGGWLYNYATDIYDLTRSGVVSIYSSQYAFVALKSNGGLVTWPVDSSSVSSSISSGVVAAYSTQHAWAALKNDGRVITWGAQDYGGNSSVFNTTTNTYTSVASSLTSGFVSLWSNQYAFAALKNDGSVVTWGWGSYGGNSSSVSSSLTSGVVAVYSTQYAFAALKNDGSVITWGGDGGNGGNSSSVSSSLTSGVVAIYSNPAAFAALKSNGSIVAWGHNGYGGSFPGWVDNSGFVSIYSTADAFAALKSNGSVITWGGGSGGDSSSVSSSLNSGVIGLTSNYYSFAALKTSASTFDLSGSVYTDMDRYTILRNKESRRRVNLTTLNNNVFTLSSSRDIQVINPNIPAGKTFKIIIPTYVASSYSITSNAVIPNSSGSFIVACDESEPVTISGTYVNYGAFVYQVNANGTYTKVTSATINGTTYTLYGGDGVFSSGIVFLELEVSTLSASTFTVAPSKTFGNAPFSFNALPTSNNTSVPIVYSSSNTNVATVDASGTTITLVGAGDVSFNATQTQTNQYAAATKTSNTLTVSRATSTLSGSSFEVPSSKTFGNAPFSFDTLPTSNNTSVAIVYSSSNTNVATVDASGTTITIVGVGDVSFNAIQPQTNQYNAATKTSNTLTVSKGTPTLAFVSPPTTKNVIDDTFTVVANSESSGAVTYTSSNPAVATVGLTTGLVTLLDIGSVTITAAQAASSQYNAPTNATCTFTIEAAASLSGQTVTISLANKNLTGTSFVNTTLNNISLAGANLSNVNFSGASIIGTNFTNANISGATNLPVFSTAQKIQLMRNANNSSVNAIQILTTLSGAEINAITATPISYISAATFVVKAPSYNVSNVKVVTVTAEDVANKQSIYIPMNANETVGVNGIAYTFDGTNILNSSGSVIQFINILETPFRVYAGSIIALNIADELNNIKIGGDGLYNILTGLFAAKT